MQSNTKSFTVSKFNALISIILISLAVFDLAFFVGANSHDVFDAKSALALILFNAIISCLVSLYILFRSEN